MDDVIHVIPEKWRGTVLVFIAISPYLGRAYHSVINGGGVRGMFNAIWFGTNTPKEK